MKKSQINLTKTCSSCGQQKPLNAFLELGVPHGTTYGNICAACRKTNLEKQKQDQEPEDSSTSESGYRIDAKAKLKIEIDKLAERERQKNLHEEEKEDKEEKKLKHIQKREDLSKEERKSRDSYRSFLDKNKKSGSSQAAKGTPQAQRDQIYLDQQRRDNEVDTSSYMVEMGMGPKEKHKSTIFQAFRSWLDSNAAIVKATEFTHPKDSEKAKQAEKTPDKEEVKEYIRKNWGPNSRR